MAFVYSQPRWQIQNKTQDNLGPGSYDIGLLKECKRLGYIEPQKIFVKSQKISQSQEHQNMGIMMRDIHHQKIKSASRKFRNLSKPANRNLSNQLITSMQDFKTQSQLKNSISKRPLHTSQSHKHFKGKRNTLMKILDRERSTPSISQDDQNTICISLRKKTRNSKLAQFRKQKHKNIPSYTKISKVVKQIDTKPINSLFIDSSNSCNLEQFPTTRKIKTATSQNRNYKNEKPDSYPFWKTSEEGPTGIQDSSQDSIEYIDDATPGPGSYNIIVQAKKIKQNFVGQFGVTVQRFQRGNKQNIEYPLLTKEPNFKRISKASQQKVAFGRSKQYEILKELPIGQSNFLSDHNSLQQKSCHDLLKSYYSPGFFLSKKERFMQKRPAEYYGPDFYYEQGDKEQKENLMIKPEAAFLSKVNRIYKVHNQTQEVDYLGQDYYTIQKRIMNKLVQQEDIDRDGVAFMRDQPRFKERVKEDQIKNNRLVGVQIHQQKSKGFTFRKGENRQNSIANQENPPVASYQVGSNWIKPSYNIKFQSFDHK